ncbi:MAG: ATP-binding protein [Thermoprotei archaeon]
MLIKPYLVLVAGGPGTGKTTLAYGLANRLKKLSYSVYVIRDWAREIIAREKPKGDRGILPWTNRVLFEYLVVKHHLEEYKRVLSSDYDIVIEDGGGFAAKAYCVVDGVELPSNYSELLEYSDRVSLVLLTTYTREIYSTDDVRWENPVYAERIHEAITRVHYELFRDRVVTIPFMPRIGDRVEYALGVIRERLGLK